MLNLAKVIQLCSMLCHQLGIEPPSTHREPWTWLSLACPANLDVQFQVWNADKQVISQWFTPLAKGGNTTARAGLPQAGEYFLEVRDGGDDDRAITSYTLTTSMAP